MATIATHNGCKAYRAHNIRADYVVLKENHINPHGQYEIWCDEEPREAYERLFGESVREYNERPSTRPEQHIKDYYGKIRDSAKQHPVYEMIVGVYDDLKDGSPGLPDDEKKRIIMEYVNGWQRRNPNLIIIGAYWHDDEPGGAHAHIDYIPVAHGYVRGPKTQPGLVKALGEQGFFKKGKATAQIQWEASENKALEEICNQHGIAVEHPQRGKNVEHKEKAQLKLEETIAQTQELVRYNEELNERCRVLERKLKQVDRAMQHAAKLARHSFKRRHTDKKFYTCDKTLIDKVLKAAEDIHQDIEAFIHTPIEVEQKFEEAEAVCNEAEEARRQAETEKRQWKQLVSQQEDIINDSAHELAQELVRSSEPDCTTETQRMKDLMQKVIYRGSTLWDYFMLLEQQRHERMLEQLQNDYEYDDDMEYDEN